MIIHVVGVPAPRSSRPAAPRCRTPADNRTRMLPLKEGTEAGATSPHTHARHTRHTRHRLRVLPQPLRPPVEQMVHACRWGPGGWGGTPNQSAQLPQMPCGMYWPTRPILLPSTRQTVISCGLSSIPATSTLPGQHSGSTTWPAARPTAFATQHFEGGFLKQKGGRPLAKPEPHVVKQVVVHSYGRVIFHMSWPASPPGHARG